MLYEIMCEKRRTKDLITITAFISIGIFKFET